MFRRCLLILAFLFPLPLNSQDLASLSADEIQLDGEDRLIASGNVEALFEDLRLTASEIIYDQQENQLQIKGPVRLTDGAGNVLDANSATLSPELQTGVIRAVTLVLQDRLTLRADEINRASTTIDSLSFARVTSCITCLPNDVPLWEVRATQVIHDKTARRLKFIRPQLRFLDIPVLTLPKLDMPDPSVKRAKGFLQPSLISSSGIGIGIRQPYFIPLGEDKDITLSPHLATKSFSLGGRYRQAFRSGDLTVTGLIADDRTGHTQPRGYAFAYGQNQLPDGYQFTYQLQLASDQDVPSDYDYTDPQDVLHSYAQIGRSSKAQYQILAIHNFNDFRLGRTTQTEAAWLAEARQQNVTQMFGGQLRTQMQAQSITRPSSTVDDGRDTVQSQLMLDWQKRMVLSHGLVLRLGAGGAAGQFVYGQDSQIDGTQYLAQSNAMAQLSLPLVKGGAGNGQSVLTPLIQFGYLAQNTPNLFNETGYLTELDEVNIWSPSRAPTLTAAPRGGSAAAALAWQHRAAAGQSMGGFIGRIWQQTDPRFVGLTVDDTRAWIVSLQADNYAGFDLMARAQLGDDMHPNKGEARARLRQGNNQYEARFVHLGADSARNRDQDISELALGISRSLRRHWTGSMDWRYDAHAKRASNIALGLGYETECLRMALSLGRGYDNSADQSASFDLRLSIDLLGLSGSPTSAASRRACER